MTSCATDLSRLVTERKHTELQILKLKQALSALQTDANLNGVLQPEKEVTSETQKSVAAIEIMIDALVEKKDKLAAEITEARHRRHDVATELQEEKEKLTLTESELDMRKHLRNSEATRAAALHSITTKNQSHQQKVRDIWIARRIKEDKALRELTDAIRRQDKKTTEASRRQEEEKSLRYEEYCRKERALTERRQLLEEEKSLRLSPSRQREAKKPISNPLPTRLATHSKEQKQTLPSPLLLAPLRGHDLLKKLDDSDRNHSLRYKLERDAKITKVVEKRQKFEKMTNSNKDDLFLKAMANIERMDEKRLTSEKRIDQLRREQEEHVIATKEERALKELEARKRANETKGDARWSRRAQRLIDSVCSDVLPRLDNSSM